DLRGHRSSGRPERQHWWPRLPRRRILLSAACDTESHSHGSTNGHRDSCFNGHGHSDTNVNTCFNSNAYTDCDTIADGNSYFDVYTVGRDLDGHWQSEHANVASRRRSASYGGT